MAFSKQDFFGSAAFVCFKEEMMKTQFQTHDLVLPDWGPYTKLYSGISHIPKAKDGVRFDLAVFPGYYRRRVDVPNVQFEGEYHMWQAAPDLSCYTIRHELMWKDAVYADISFAGLNEHVRLIRAECCNNTDVAQNLVLHYMASAHDPSPSYRDFKITGAQVQLPQSGAFVLAVDYDDLKFAVPRHNQNLNWDGMRRAEEAVQGFVKGYGVGNGFGAKAGTSPMGQQFPDGAGDRVWYTFTLKQPLKNPCLCVRYLNDDQQDAVYTLPGGEKLILVPTKHPQIAYTPLSEELAAGEYSVVLTSQGTGQAKLDCLLVCEMQQRDAFSVSPRGDGFTPQIQAYPQEHFLTLKYPHIDEYYGILWNFEDTQLRQIENDELDVFLRYKAHDHVNDILKGNGRGHFTNVFMRPIPLQPRQTKTIYGVVCSANTQLQAAEICREWSKRKEEFEQCWQAAAQAMQPMQVLPNAGKFAFGQQLMQAVLCSNVVYPVYTRSQYIRHNTPGRWWDCLYTWDSGFIGMGLTTFSLRRGFDCLNAYLTPPGDDEAAFIHHGSMVPTQFYLFAELLNRTQSKQLAEYCYPRLMQYYLFYIGKAGNSTTANMKSGLLRPWDYFYNSGGWDDYPPQKAMHQQKLGNCCTPVITTAHAVRCAKILQYTAQFLERWDDVEQLQQDVQNLTDALQRYSWDEESGYFGYVLHDAQGYPIGLFRSEDNSNYNMGLGGASPLFASVCTKHQQQILWKKLKNEDQLWCSCGLSTVDQTASYYRHDGYWNGAVWMPYQWMFFKAALDCGDADFAFKIADTALHLWQQECENSYLCFEHFMIESRRGAGWHQFGGLSAPVVQFYETYYRIGTITTGWDTFVQQAAFDEQYTAAHLILSATQQTPCTILVAMQTGNREVVCEGAEVLRVYQRHEGLWEITMRPTGRTVRLDIR